MKGRVDPRARAKASRVGDPRQIDSQVLQPREPGEPTPLKHLPIAISKSPLRRHISAHKHWSLLFIRSNSLQPDQSAGVHQPKNRLGQRIHS
jgi:hypothetical protein